MLLGLLGNVHTNKHCNPKVPQDCVLGWLFSQIIIAEDVLLAGHVLVALRDSFLFIWPMQGINIDFQAQGHLQCDTNLAFSPRQEAQSPSSQRHDSKASGRFKLSLPSWIVLVKGVWLHWKTLAICNVELRFRSQSRSFGGGGGVWRCVSGTAQFLGLRLCDLGGLRPLTSIPLRRWPFLERRHTHAHVLIHVLVENLLIVIHIALRISTALSFCNCRARSQWLFVCSSGRCSRRIARRSVVI